MKRENIIIVVLFFVFALAFFVYVILPIFNFSQFFESLRNINLAIFSLACLVMLIANTFGAYRWSVLISEANAPKSGLFFNAFGFYSLGQITGLVVPSRIGNYAKVPLVMKLDNIPYESGLSAVNAETLLDLAYISLAGIASLSILSVYLYSSFEFVSIILLFLLIAILIGILVILYKLDHFEEIYEKSRSHAGETGRHLLTRIPSRFFSKIFELTQSTKNIFTNRYCLLKTGSSTVIFQFIGIFSFFLVIESAHVTLSFPVTFAILTLSILAGIISLIPGGLGASDLSLVVLLVSQGITLPVATNIVILWRIVMYLPILLVIGIYLLKRNERPKDSASQ